MATPFWVSAKRVTSHVVLDSAVPMALATDHWGTVWTVNSEIWVMCSAKYDAGPPRTIMCLGFN